MDELGASMVMELSEDLVLKGGQYSKAVIMVTSFVWDYEHILARLRGPWEEVRELDLCTATTDGLCM